jgi:hypothetical protein
LGEVQSAKIPFGNLLASGFEEVAGASPSAFNIITEPITGVIRRRPGLVSFSEDISGDSIVGLFETTDGTLWAVDDAATRSIYKVVSGSSINISNIPDGDVRGRLRPIFAETEAMLVIAGGREPEKVLLPSSVPSRLGGTPPNGSHVAANSERLIMNEVVDQFKNRINYSDRSGGTSTTGNETWGDNPDVNVSNSIAADAKPDPIVAIHENTNEIFAFGSTSLQIYAPAQAGIVFAPSVAKQYGCGAPYSVVEINDSFAWIDQFRRVIVSNGREMEILSEPIQRSILDMASVSDAFGYRIVIGPIDVLVWTFPSERRTFAFQKGSGWADWTLKGAGPSEQWNTFPVTSSVARKSGATVAGDSLGRVSTFTLGAGDFGTDIDANMTTGFQDRGTDHRKHCRSVRVALRPLTQVDLGAPVARLSYRDGTGAWEPPLTVAWGREPVVQFDSLGVYRRRQWKFEFTGSTDMALVSVTEDFEVLEN